MQALNLQPVGAAVRDGGSAPQPPPPRPASEPRRARWTLADIPYDAIDVSVVRGNQRLFQLVAAASFVEITSDTYTRNLVEYYRGDDEVIAWLEDGWQREELQHGAALRRYVETAWPHFDWERAYRSFMGEYSVLCAVDRLADSRALEMVARCVVETGTSSFYRMLSEAAPEPVLALLAAKISADEVDHFKHFYRYFRRYAALERTSRTAVFRTLMTRMVEVDAEDAACAFRHVCLIAYPDARSGKAEYDAFRGAVRDIALQHYRYDMAVKMLLKPLGLGGRANRVVIPTATALTRHFLFR